MTIEFEKGLINAPGFLGFAPSAETAETLNVLDAFVCNAISYRRRRSARQRGVISGRDYALLHSGHPNPGFFHAQDLYRRKWESANLGVIVSLLAEDPSEMAIMVNDLEGMDNLYAIQIMLHEEFDASFMKALTQAALGKTPLIVNLPASRCLDEGAKLIEAGADMLAMGPGRREMPEDEGEQISGRVYGAGEFADILKTSEEMAKQRLIFIASGGIYSPGQAKQLLSTGASAIALDTVLWKADWNIADWQDLRD